MIARKTCTAYPSRSIDGPESKCNHDHQEYALCDFCGLSIPDGEVIEFFPREQWHALCVHKAEAIPGFFEAGEVFALGAR